MFPIQANTVPHSISSKIHLKITKFFIYLGAILSYKYCVDAEVCSRIGEASFAFVRIRKRVNRSHNLTLTARVAVYIASVCNSMVLKPSLCMYAT